jgi:hypothetical protein
MLLDARCKLALLVSLLYVSTASSPAALAQDNIRVETSEVLVPVLVIHSERVWRFREDPDSFWRAYFAGDMQHADRVIESFVVRGLTADNFQVFEDDKEQVIQSVSYKRSLYWNVRDNRGHHTEFISQGGGKWTTTEWSSMFGDVEPPFYLITYALPVSAEGSCHKIRVKLKGNYPDAFVRARGEYCNNVHSASDPLSGTKLGKKMESDLVGPKNGKIDISLLAVALYTNNDATRVHIAVDWPWKSLDRLRTKGVVGMLFKEDGSLARRFSDLSERYEGVPDRSAYIYSDLIDGVDAETRYERQLNLPPGKYHLRVVVSDGAKFGRAEMHLTVDNYNRKDLDIGAVSLCKEIDDVSPYSPRYGPELPGAWTATPPTSYVPLVSNDIEFKPTGNTRFKKGATLYTYFEVYEPSLAGQSPATVQFQMRIVDLQTSEVKSDSEPISAAPYAKVGSPVIPIGRGIDISKLPPGLYRLDVQATDSAGKSTPWRTANFTIK